MKTLNSTKGNIKKLLSVTDYKSIKAIQKENPDLSRKVIEEWLLDNYNSVIELVNENIMEIKKEQKREYAKKKRKTRK